MLLIACKKHIMGICIPIVGMVFARRLLGVCCLFPNIGFFVYGCRSCAAHTAAARAAPAAPCWSLLTAGAEILLVCQGYRRIDTCYWKYLVRTSCESRCKRSYDRYKTNGLETGYLGWATQPLAVSEDALKCVLVQTPSTLT